MQTGSALSLTGNEITDTQRRAALLWGVNQLGGSTDGLAPPAGVGIWEAGTNLFRHGQCDNANDWNGAVTGSSPSVDINTSAPFSPQSIKVVNDGTNASQGVNAASATGQNAATGTVGVGSVYFKGVAGQSYTVKLRWNNTDASNTTGTITTFNASGNWQLLIPVSLAVAVGKTGDQLLILIQINGTRAETFNVAHAMLQTGVNVVSPYVATSGGNTATRNAGRTRVPVCINAIQSWVVVNAKMGYPSTANPFPGSSNRFFAWGTTDNPGRILGLFTPGTGIRVYRSANGVLGNQVAINSIFNQNDILTCIFAWDIGNLYLSVNGSIFSSVSNNNNPAITDALFGIGVDAGAVQLHLDGNVQWAAAGIGKLSNNDAATINGFGNTLPSLEEFPGKPTFGWSAITQQTILQPSGFATAFSDMATNWPEFAL